MLLLIKDFHGWGGHHLGCKHTSARPAPLCWLFSGLAAELSSLWAAHVQMLRQGRPSRVGRGPRVFVRTSASREHHSPRDERRSAGPSPPTQPSHAAKRMLTHSVLRSSLGTFPHQPSAFSCILPLKRPAITAGPRAFCVLQQRSICPQSSYN